MVKSNTFAIMENIGLRFLEVQPFHSVDPRPGLSAMRACEKIMAEYSDPTQARPSL